jgi:putative addiction module killer protein
MEYKIKTTNIYDEWFATIKDKTNRARILKRQKSIQLGNLGTHKSVGENLFELKFYFGPGFRVYFTIKEDLIVLLLCGGDKSTQGKDIDKAKMIQKIWEENQP